jgi:hypothetical protein
VTITFNPVITTNAAGTFSVTLDGLIQGMAMDDPSARVWLTGGQLAMTETLPMFGGIPITENLPVPIAPGVAGAPGPDPSLQTVITRAVAPSVAANGGTGMTGISVFNQNFAAINTPQSPVPQVSNGMMVNLYRFGTNARIPMAMDPALAAALPGLIIGPTLLFWNIANQWVTATGPAGAGILALPVNAKIVDYNIGNSMTVAYDVVTGFATWVRNGNCILLQI